MKSSRTKIVATIGPASIEEDSIVKLIDAGVDVFRLNGSHADLDWHSSAISRLRSLAPLTPILLDVPGRKIRTGDLGEGYELEVGRRIYFCSNLASPEFKGVKLNSDTIPEAIRPGDSVFGDDGTLEFKILQVFDDAVECEVLTAGLLRSRKGINFPTGKLGGSLVSERDLGMFHFATQHSVDFIGISFVESSHHVAQVREVLDGKSPKIVAKIENEAGYRNRRSIIEAADAIMIDRGDLATETGRYSVGVRQRSVIQDCADLSTPVIVATEMLDSMTTSPFPTQAEVSDVSNAAFQGVAATMLSAETAVGRYPVESVQTMAGILSSALSMEHTEKVSPSRVADLFLEALRSMLQTGSFHKCVLFSRSGYAVARASALGLSVPIIGVSDDAEQARAFGLYRGVQAAVATRRFTRDTAMSMPSELKHLESLGFLHQGERVLCGGLIFPKSGERLNFLYGTDVEF